MKILTPQSFVITILIALSAPNVWAHDPAEQAKEVTEAPKSHLSAMSEDDLEVVTDHGHTKDVTDEKSPHTHGDEESLLKNNILYIERNLLTTPQSVIQPQPLVPSVSPSKP
ncbi:MAG: hypothetical protein KGO49_08305 [Gammaproteobacteria bacterium]|nr:hypothetical protein [Gammaproteobacteria bacterium]